MVRILLAFTCIELYFVQVNQQNSKWGKKTMLCCLTLCRKHAPLALNDQRIKALNKAMNFKLLGWLEVILSTLQYHSSSQ